MLSKNQIKNITALHVKKFRREENMFVAEGEKVVAELLDSGWNVRAVYGTPEYFQKFTGKVRIPKNTEVVLITPEELKKISALTTPQSVLAVADIPGDQKKINYEAGLKFVLEGINDPGNLGTLIRIADWFGIDEIICSPETADCFNPKVVQSAMGSLFRVNIFYVDLASVFKLNNSLNKLPVYGMVLDGNSLFNEKLMDDGFIVLGNESSGISPEIMHFITRKLTIPPFQAGRIDSLNVAVAAGIVCAEFRRN